MSADDLRIALAGGYFRAGAGPEAQTALSRVAGAVGAKTEIEIPEVTRARAAAYVISASEGAALHLERLRRAAYDPFDARVIALSPFDIWRLLPTAMTGRF